MSHGPGIVDVDHTHTEEEVLDLDHTDTAAIHDDTSSEISAITEKSSPVEDDILIIEDSEASNVKKKITLANLPNSGSGEIVWADYDYSSEIQVDSDNQELMASAAQTIAVDDLYEATVHVACHNEGGSLAGMSPYVDINDVVATNISPWDVNPTGASELWTPAVIKVYIYVVSTSLTIFQGFTIGHDDSSPAIEENDTHAGAGSERKTWIEIYSGDLTGSHAFQVKVRVENTGAASQVKVPYNVWRKLN